MKDRERMRKQSNHERTGEGFSCNNCGGWVEVSESMGTHHRNHCPSCLCSKHVDLEKPGDRKASCNAGMKPIGLTFKQAGINKYGKPRQGELMIIHQCTNTDCDIISINRIASDDNSGAILSVFEKSQTHNDVKGKIKKMGINLLTKHDEEEVRTQLFGKS